MMTELEARGEAIATAIIDREEWTSKSEKVAIEHLRKLRDSGQISPADCDLASDNVRGSNSSAQRQKFERMGFIKTSETDSAEKRAIETALKRLNAEKDAMTQKAMDAFEKANAKVDAKASK